MDFVLGADRIKMGILPVKGSKNQKILNSTVLELIYTEIRALNRYDVTSKEEIVNALNNNNIESCHEKECAAQIGIALKAKRMILSSLAKTGNSYEIRIQVFDVEQGKTYLKFTEIAGSEDVLFEKVKSISQKIGKKIGLIGHITKVSGDYILCNIGRQDQVALRQEVEIIRDLGKRKKRKKE